MLIPAMIAKFCTLSACPCRFELASKATGKAPKVAPKFEALDIE
jgi:hypothetical protein